MARKIGMPKWVRISLAFILQLVPILLILLQSNGALFELANSESGKYFTFLMFAIASIGAGLHNNTWRKSIIVALCTFFTLTISVIIFGEVGLLNAQVEDIQTGYEDGIIFALDGLTGVTEGISVLGGIVDILKNLIPTVVLVWGIIGVLLSDSPDEMTTPLIETGVGIALLALYYGLGGYLGFA